MRANAPSLIIHPPFWLTVIGYGLALGLYVLNALEESGTKITTPSIWRWVAVGVLGYMLAPFIASFYYIYNPMLVPKTRVQMYDSQFYYPFLKFSGVAILGYLMYFVQVYNQFTIWSNNLLLTDFFAGTCGSDQIVNPGFAASDPGKVCLIDYVQSAANWRSVNMLSMLLVVILTLCFIDCVAMSWRPAYTVDYQTNVRPLTGGRKKGSSNSSSKSSDAGDDDDGDDTAELVGGRR